MAAKASQYLKAYVRAGFDYEFVRNVAFTLDWQRGLGAQFVHGGPNNLIGNFWSTNIGFQYQVLGKQRLPQVKGSVAPPPLPRLSIAVHCR